MKREFLLKITALLIVFGAFIDTNFELLLSVGIPTKWINAIKLIGLAIVAFLPSVNGMLKRDGEPEDPPIDEGIGGGGIKNPKP